MDEEYVGQLREVGGRALAACDLCGVPVLKTSLVVMSARRTHGEPVEQVRACSACSRLVEADALPLDAEADSGELLPDQ